MVSKPLTLTTNTMTKLSAIFDNENTYTSMGQSIQEWTK